MEMTKPKERAYIEYAEKHIAEAELEQPLPAKEENAGSNPTSDTCAYCGKQNCEHQKLAREHLFNHRNIAL